MITADKNTVLTPRIISQWIAEYSRNFTQYKMNRAAYKNKWEDGRIFCSIPFAKKMVITVVSAAIGGGVVISYPEKEKGYDTFNEIAALLRKQNISRHDTNVVRAGSIYGRGYELVYLSDDLVPIPKCAEISPFNAFVVYDDTVEHDSLYGVIFTKDKDEHGNELFVLTVYDKEYYYSFKMRRDLPDGTAMPEGIPHNLGRMPLTELANNEEGQGDFEQVLGLIADRSFVHDMNIRDIKKIAKNYLKTRDIAFAAGKDGKRIDDPAEILARRQMIEIGTDDMPSGISSDATIISKQEDYSSVDIFGRDINRQIYDQSNIPDFSSDEYTAAQSGVAMRQKLLPFKQLLATKDYGITMLYQRRIKMYAHFLEQRGFESVDMSKITIEIRREWEQDITEIATTIVTLSSTGKFSDETLINMLPYTDYETEKRRKEAEGKADPLNQTTAWLQGNNAMAMAQRALKEDTDDGIREQQSVE